MRRSDPGGGPHGLGFGCLAAAILAAAVAAVAAALWVIFAWGVNQA